MQSPSGNKSKIDLDLRFLRTCHQLYNETKHEPYARNDFAFNSFLSLGHFIKNPHVACQIDFWKSKVEYKGTGRCVYGGSLSQESKGKSLKQEVALSI